MHSLDVTRTADSRHLKYHEANRKLGRYVGTIRTQFEFAGEVGPLCGWLHVDPETLAVHAESSGWKCQIVRQEVSGEYLAQLRPA